MQLICAREQYLFGEGTCASTPTKGSRADNSEVIAPGRRLGETNFVSWADNSEVIEVRVRTASTGFGSACLVYTNFVKDSNDDEKDKDYLDIGSYTDGREDTFPPRHIYILLSHNIYYE